MKKIFTLLIGILLVLSLFAQHNKKHHVRFNRLQYKSVSDYVNENLPNFLQPKLFTSSNTQAPLSTDVVKQALDSIVIMGPNWTKELFLSEVDHYSYNSRGLCTEVLIIDYDPNTGIAKPRSKEVATYDNQNRPKEYIYYQWEENSSVWQEENKIEYVFMGDLLSEFILYSWDNNSNQWENEMKDEMTYDDHNDMVLFVVYHWEDGEYKNSNKEEISYENHYVKEEIGYIWMASSGDWTPTFKDVYTYDGNWNTILDIQSSWVDEWRDYDKREMTYDGDKLILSVHSSNYTYSEWTFEDKEEYSYTGEGSLLEILKYRWNYESWVFSYKYAYSYNDAHTFDELLLPFDWGYGDDLVYQLTSVFESSWFSDNWTDEFQFLMYYSAKEVNAIPEMSLGDISVYPNPNNGVFTLKIDQKYQNAEVAIIDFFGRLLSTETISNSQSAIEKSFDLSAYGAGIYFLRITQDNHSVYKKVVLQ